MTDEWDEDLEFRLALAEDLGQPAVVLYTVAVPGTMRQPCLAIALCAEHARTFRPARTAERMDCAEQKFLCDLCLEERDLA